MVEIHKPIINSLLVPKFQGIFYLAGQVVASQLTTGTLSQDTLYFVPFCSSRRGSFDEIGFFIETLSLTEGALAKLAIYIQESDGIAPYYPLNLVYGSDGIDVYDSTGSTGKNTITGLNIDVKENTLYYLSIVTNVDDLIVKAIPSEGMTPILGNSFADSSGTHFTASFIYADPPDDTLGLTFDISESGTPAPALGIKII